MAAVLIGGVIMIWLALSGGRALLRALSVQPHWPAPLVAPLVLAALETALFLPLVATTELLPEPQRWPVAGALTALAWAINGAVAAAAYRRRSYQRS